MTRRADYTIVFSSGAAKQFRKLPADAQSRLRSKFDALALDPRPAGSKKLTAEENLYRIRAGDYRAIYSIKDDVLTVLVVKVGHRRDVYK